MTRCCFFLGTPWNEQSLNLGLKQKCSKCHSKQSKSEHRTMRKKTNIHFPSRPISSQHFLSSNSPKPWHSPNKKFVNQNVVPNQKRSQNCVTINHNLFQIQIPSSVAGAMPIQVSLSDVFFLCLFALFANAWSNCVGCAPVRNT